VRSDSPVLKALSGVLGAVLLVVVGVLALAPGSIETEVFPGVTLGDPPDAGTTEASSAVVVGKNTSGGTSWFGLPFGRSTFRIRVQFYTSAECSALLDAGERWPVPYDECPSPVGIEGEVAGQGIAPTGHSIVAVDVEVTRECSDAVSAGDPWPTPADVCADG